MFGGFLFALIYGIALLLCRERFVMAMLQPVFNRLHVRKTNDENNAHGASNAVTDDMQTMEVGNDELRDLRTFAASCARWIQSAR